MSRTINEAGLDIIKSQEGLRLKAYRDGGGVPTIGWGHTAGVRMGQTITKERAEELLRMDIAHAEKAVISYAMTGLNDNEFSALVSFVFNVGVAAYHDSTLLKKLRQGDRAGAAEEFLRWNHDNGRVIDGLTARRNRERVLFLTPPSPK